MNNQDIKQEPNALTSTRTKSVNERIDEFKAQNPEVQKTLELFNITSNYYEVSCNALRTTKTYVTTSTILPV